MTDADEDAEKIFLRNIQKYLYRVNDTSGKPFKVSASVGVCSVKAADFEFEAALKQSDEKMYIMKIGRPNRRRDRYKNTAGTFPKKMPLRF